MEDSSYLGFGLKQGHSKAFSSLCMYVYIYARFWSGSSERIIWLHRQTLLQFSLAGVRAGVCLRIPLVQRWCLRLRPLKLGVLSKMPFIRSISGLWLSNRDGNDPLVCSTWSFKFWHEEDLDFLSFPPFLVCDETSLSRGLDKANTHTDTQIAHLVQLSALSTSLSLPAVRVPHSCPPLLPPPSHISPLFPYPGLLASGPDF